MAQPQRTANRAEEQADFSNRPAHTVRHGNVEIAIWRNEGASGEYFSASAPKTSYKDGDDWKDGSSFGRHDLLDLAEAAREAATKMRDLQTSRAAGSLWFFTVISY